MTIKPLIILPDPSCARFPGPSSASTTRIRKLADDMLDDHV